MKILVLQSLRIFTTVYRETSEMVFGQRKGKNMSEQFWWKDRAWRIVQTNLREIDMADSPIEIIRQFYAEEEQMALQFFSGSTALSRFMKSDFPEYSQENSCFELITIDGDSIKANWKSALLDQLEIKEAMENIVNEDQIPTFVVHVGPTFAA